MPSKPNSLATRINSSGLALRLSDRAIGAVLTPLNISLRVSRLRFGSVVLKQIERNPSAFTQGDNFAVHKGARWKPFARTGNVRELVCEEISPPRPQSDPTCVYTSQTTVAVKLYLVEPFLALGKFLNR